MNKSPSPEERLLGLIRKDKTGGKDKADSPAQEFPERPAVNPWARRRWVWPSSFSLRTLKITLAVIAAALLSYIIFVVLLFPGSNDGAPKVANVSQVEEKKAAGEIPAVKPYSDYARKFEQRDIFGLPSTTENAGPLEQAQAGLPQSVNDLKLVGIILDDNPQAVIENEKENKTYFLHQDEFINNLKVSQINEGKVILSNDGQNWELSL